MSLIHDIIKIKYTRLGYLPNYPYHLISDEEMFNAFIDLSGDDSTSGSGELYSETFFDDYYPNPFVDGDIVVIGPTGEEISLTAEYYRLKSYIISCIQEYLIHQGAADESEYELPDWIYTYMLGEVIYNTPDPNNQDTFTYKDIYDLLKLFDATNISNEITPEICKQCYQVSTKYISTLTTGIRPPTVFGEPHVIKQLRLEG